ncbi:pseudaminic acid cytidylyltransferase [Candidatus Omnitrophota bacterium]
MSNKCIAIIPARGGSKRIPRKNIKPFLGQPIIKYSIDAALDAGIFDHVMVSTDDKEIAEIAKSFRAEIPFLRSEKTSGDHATLADVIEEVIVEYKKRDEYFEYFCCILATAPFILSERLVQAIQLLKNSEADSIVPVVRYGYPIQRALKIENSKLEMVWPENYEKRSKDLMSTYHDCGQFYCMRTRPFLQQKKLFAKYTVPIEIAESEVQDIDNEEDWKVAELKYKILRGIEK